MKRFFFSCFILAASCSAWAQQQVTIQGKVPASLDQQYIYLSKSGTGTLLDSAQIQRGTFKITRAQEDTVLAVLRLSVKNGARYRNGSRELYLSPGDRITVTVNREDTTNLLKGAVVKGSRFTAQLDELTASLATVTKSIDSMRELNMRSMEQKNFDTTGYYVRNKAFKELFAEDKKIRENYIAAHPDYYVSLITFSVMQGRRVLDVPAAQQVFDKFPAALRTSAPGQKMAALLKASATVSLQQIAPDFTCTTPTGTQLKLSDLRGKYLLLDFWASWCGPCRAENPNVVKAFQRFKDKNFDILGVSLDREGDHNKWTAAIEKDALTWHHVSDLKWWKSDIAKLYLISSIPQNFLLDPNGRIIAVNLRGEALEQELEKVLGK
ncbi:TlpA disulfide reductase family protein [Chitinophaga nivalis]|uniref:AhpC/TSA family protein n=1 Tax=Chitinophaga nivalis TaxID=2991709 RepID=A0ABT3IGE0_9BACT|nr:TlpA disulfide reductase family protein [Chitinophaga nivalis]MCW3467312.1 AhpC/TSA family protein [Chitinophaga nivalis]MCW3482996.1 AhpC/TSA family protein [Chitinophaga nivalis]